MKKNRNVFIALLLALGLLPVFFGSRALFKGLTQTNDSRDKQITRPHERNEPVDVVDVQSAQKKIEFGKIFRQDGDWLKDFAVSYKNKTNKAVVSMSVGLTFPETGETGNVMMYGLSFGTPRKAALKGERTVVVQPGDIMRVSIDEKEFKKLQTFIGQRHLLQSLSKVELTIEFILFDDGTAWAGQYRIQDPNRPGVWIEDPKQKAVNR